MNNLLITLAQQLINQPSITPNDHHCQCIIANYLKKINFYTETINFKDTHNLWAYHTNNNQNTHTQFTLLFLGHTDVVPPGNLKNWNYPPFSGTIKNGILYGRGSSDMKGSIAAMLIATNKFILKHPNHKGRIAFLFTSDEEGSGENGTIKTVQVLLKRQERIDYCIIGEPSSQFKIGDVIKNGRRGSYTGKLTIYGSQGHVAYPEFSQNPIHLIIPILSELLITKWDYKKSLLFPDTSMQITNIYTYPYSKNNNIIPNQLILYFNFRFNDQSSIDNIETKMHKILSHYPIKYDIFWENPAEPYFSAPGKLTDIVIDVIKYYQKITPQLETSGGTSDGRFLIKTNTEIIELGALNHTIHKINECVNLSDLELLSSIYLQIMINSLL